MLPDDGPVLAPPGISPAVWGMALPADAMPLVLAPGSSRGWLGGQAVVAAEPVSCADGLSLPEAAEVLERAMSGELPGLAVALLRYDGPAMAAHYPGGLVLSANGWRVWGECGRAERVRHTGSTSEIATGAIDAGAAADPAAKLGTCRAADHAATLAFGLTTDLDSAAFCDSVAATADAIRAGSVYVLNLTRRLTGRPAIPPPHAFAALLSRTRADMAALWRTPALEIASASPERFLRILGPRIEVWPMKGTRPRAGGRGPGWGRDAAERDRQLAKELAASGKERAEHVMIVDLERNDLGRVCEAGSIAVDPLCEVIATPYCHQMISCVSGLLRPGVSLAETLAATFPCGSVTGAPKIAAMREIARLERSPRGVYTGALLVATLGHLDSSVLIRTAEYEGHAVRWGTGCGITVDSDPAEEWYESVLKAGPFCGAALTPGTAG